jgi:cytochrome c-type biogenesis protein CcmH
VRLRLATAALLAVALLALAPLVAGAAARTSVSEVEAEVMCPVCGTLLELAESPQAQRQKAFIKQLVGSGATKEQIKDALVAEYGREVLALPEGKGFSLSAYLVPVIAFVLAVIALAFGVWRWRRASNSGDGPGAPAVAGPSAAENERLDADLGRYDL